MNPDDESEDAHGAPPREDDHQGGSPGEPDRAAAEGSEASEYGRAPAGYAPPRNMYAMGVEEPEVAHADAEVAEGEPEDGEYVDAELEQYQAALTPAYRTDSSEDDEDDAEDGDGDEGGDEGGASHDDEDGAEGEEEERIEAEADAPALEDDSQNAAVAHEASEAGEADDDDGDTDDDDDDGDEADDDDDDDDDEDDDEEDDDDEDDKGDDEDDEAEGALADDPQEYAQQEADQEELAQEAYEDPPPEEVDHTVAAFAQQTADPDEPGALYEPIPAAPAPPAAAPPQQRQQQRQQKQEPPRQAPARQRRVLTPVQDDDGFLFGAPDIPMPPARRRIDKQRARDARANLDLDLGRIKRIKRFGLVITTLTVLFVAFVLAPVTWVGAYLFFDPPANVLMMQRAAEGETIRHQPIPINRMSPHVVRAVIAAEDANFCAHDGFDVEAIQGAMQANARGGRTRGASTVSQQTAKNLFLWPDRSWLRKGLETYFTALIEFMWPKRRVMEAYLNTAEWGDGIFGVEAAARARFGVSAADLTPLQAARLAAVLPNPNRWRADAPGPYVRQRSAMLVGRARVVRDERLAACVLNLDRPG